jgi:hypothetical protein
MCNSAVIEINVNFEYDFNKLGCNSFYLQKLIVLFHITVLVRIFLPSNSASYKRKFGLFPDR